jgi:ribonuclease P protein component
VSPLPHSRVAVVVGKQGHSIVDRNRLRRRLRELVRLNLLPACTGVDIVLRTLAQAYDVEFSVLAAEVQTLAQKLELEVLDS